MWQWIHQDRTTDDGTPITRDYIEGLIAEVLGEVERRRTGDRFEDAAEIFREVALGEDFPAFLTLPAYSRFLVEADEPGATDRDRMPRTTRGAASGLVRALPSSIVRRRSTHRA